MSKGLIFGSLVFLLSVFAFANDSRTKADLAFGELESSIDQERRLKNTETPGREFKSNRNPSEKTEEQRQEIMPQANSGEPPKHLTEAIDLSAVKLCRNSENPRVMITPKGKEINFFTDDSQVGKEFRNKRLDSTLYPEATNQLSFCNYVERRSYVSKFREDYGKKFCEHVDKVFTQGVEHEFRIGCKGTNLSPTLPRTTSSATSNISGAKGAK